MSAPATATASTEVQKPLISTFEKEENHSVAAPAIEEVSPLSGAGAGADFDFNLPAQPVSTSPETDAQTLEVEPSNRHVVEAVRQSERFQTAKAFVCDGQSRLAFLLTKNYDEIGQGAQHAMGLTYTSFDSSNQTELQGRLGQAVRSRTFQITMIAIIFAYGLQLGVQTDYMARHMLTTIPTSFRVLETGFLCIFFIELLLRLYVYRLRFFWMGGWGWNLFDFALVGVQIIEELLSSITTQHSSGVWPVLRLLRTFRTVRVMRVLRLMTMLSELRVLATCIVQSFKTFYWVMVLLGLMIYITGIFCTHTITHVRVKKASEAVTLDANIEFWYGSVPRTVLSLFQGLTGGVDWNDLVQPFLDHASAIAGFVLVLWFAFAFIAVLNVVTGTFVENAIAQAHKVQDMVKLQKTKAVFKFLDVDQSGGRF